MESCLHAYEVDDSTLAQYQHAVDAIVAQLTTKYERELSTLRAEKVSLQRQNLELRRSLRDERILNKQQAVAAQQCLMSLQAKVESMRPFLQESVSARIQQSDSALEETALILLDPEEEVEPRRTRRRDDDQATAAAPSSSNNTSSTLKESSSAPSKPSSLSTVGGPTTNVGVGSSQQLRVPHKTSTSGKTEPQRVPKGKVAIDLESI